VEHSPLQHRPPNNPAHMVTPALHPRTSDRLLDSEKIGASLLLSGVFLALVGVTFTAMGWQHFQSNLSYEWTQLLGPILISVGGTFILTSVCKFGIATCFPCRRREEEEFVIPVREQPPVGHPFVFHGINQPVMLGGTTTMLCIPPPCSFTTPEVRQASEFQPGSSVSSIQAALPPYDAVCCVDNAGFTAEEGSSAHSTETGQRRSEGGRSDESGSTCSHPPAYEDIYPSFHKHNPT
uniref:Transmembrane protein 174 n=1 Tax=Acanthochromis polyacanthus TaxID=80966 RepID=A0A3Q1H560_9TELE